MCALESPGLLRNSLRSPRGVSASCGDAAAFSAEGNVTSFNKDSQSARNTSSAWLKARAYIQKRVQYQQVTDQVSLMRGVLNMKRNLRHARMHRWRRPARAPPRGHGVVTQPDRHFRALIIYNFHESVQQLQQRNPTWQDLTTLQLISEEFYVDFLGYGFRICISHIYFLFI